MIRIIFLSGVLIGSFFTTQVGHAYEQEVQRLSSSMAEKISKTGKKTVAVVDFTNLQGQVTELGRFLAEEFSVAIAGSEKGFEVVDRTHLKTLLKEHKLSTTDVMDPSTAKKLGQIAGVDALITGTITPFGDSVRLSVKILDTATAKVVSALSSDIAKTRAIEELMARGVDSELPESQSAAKSSPSNSPTNSKQVQEAEMFKFTLLGCKRTSGGVNCDLQVVNEDNDRELHLSSSYTPFYGGTRLFDQSGNEYQPEVLTLGNRQGRRSDNMRPTAILMLIRGVATRASVTFGGASLPIERIALLELGGYVGGMVKLQVQFRDIVVSK